MIPDAGQALDQHRHAGQGPEGRAEAMGARALAQGEFDVAQLLRSQPGLAAGTPRAPQRGAAAGAPGVIPPHDALPADAESPGNRTLRLPACGKQPRRLMPTNFQSVEIPSRRNVSGGHASMVRRQGLNNVTILYETQ
jgi:hypothetical protein